MTYPFVPTTCPLVVVAPIGCP